MAKKSLVPEAPVSSASDGRMSQRRIEADARVCVQQCCKALGKRACKGRCTQRLEGPLANIGVSGTLDSNVLSQRQSTITPQLCFTQKPFVVGATNLDLLSYDILAFPSHFLGPSEKNL